MKGKLLLVLLALAFVFGCSLAPPADEGTLVLSLSSQALLRAKTIEPDLDMNVDHYDIYGVGPSDASFEQLGVAETAVVQASLVPGEWVITVEAYNADSPAVLIGIGSVTVTIVSGEVLSVPVTVDPIAGPGQLDVTVQWPAGVLLNPVVDGTLTPSGGSAAAVSFVNATDDLSSNYQSPGLTDTAALPEGYYTLVVTLSTDRSDGSGSDLVWGTVEAVRIIAGEISAKTYVLEEDVNRGGLELHLQLENPIEVTISGVLASLSQNTSITATADPAGLSSYEWYLDGVSIGTGNPFTFSTGVVGHHWLNVIVTSGDVMSSGTVEFDVTESVVLVVALEAATYSTSYDDMSYYESVLDAQGFDARVVSGADIDTLAEMQVFDVVMISDSSKYDNDLRSFSAVLVEFVSQGGGLIDSGFIPWWMAHGGLDSNIVDLIPVEGSLYLEDSTIISAVGSHPIMQGVGSWMVAAYTNSGPAKSGATVVAVDGSGTEAVVVWDYGQGRVAHLGPNYLVDGSYGHFSQWDGTIPDALTMLVNAINWAGGN